MGFVSFFKIIQGTSIDPHFQICSQISPFLNIYKFDHDHFEYFTPYCTLIPWAEWENGEVGKGEKRIGEAGKIRAKWEWAKWDWANWE